MADRIVAIAGMKLNEANPMVRAFAESFTRVVIYPTRSLNKAEENAQSEEERIAEEKKARTINLAAMRAMDECKRNGEVILVFPSGTRYRPGKPETKRGLKEIDSYLRMFDVMILVSVNGTVVKDPAEKIDLENDVIEYRGERVAFEEYRYFVLNKPAGVVSATQDNRDQTVLDLIHEPYAKELFPAGRLDRDTEGLLLLTSDGKMSHELLSPKKHVEKTYYVVIDGTPDPEMVERFREGLEIGEKKPTLPAGMVFLDTDQEASGEAITGTIESISAADLKRCGKEECCAIVTITEGKFHQIKRMFRAVGRQVHFLKRIAVGNLWLDPTLAPGQYRPLTEEELDLLKNSPPGQSLS